MKYFIMTICLGAAILFSSCKKDVATLTANPIVGTWELRQAQNGMIPTTAYSPGNGDIFKFSDSAFENYRNGSLINSGHYILIQDPSVEAQVGLVIPAGQFTKRIIFNNDFASRKTFIEVSNDTLIFLSGFFPLDGGSNLLYKKIK